MTARKPIIGLTTYRKVAAQSTPIPLYALMPSYVDAVAAAGGVPVLIPLGLDEASLATLLDGLDGLLLTGGGDIAAEFYGSERDDLITDVDTDRDRVELFLARTAFEQGKPTLAICRGHQMLNVALGGTLYEDVASLMPNAHKHDYFGEHPRNHRPHTVTIEPGSKLAEVLPPGTDLLVNSLHHQGIRDLAPDLVPVAFAPDGLIEGVEAPSRPFIVGVQWHPENLVGDDPLMLGLFRQFVAAAAAEPQPR
jgi:putative glutamine amidotransferase